MDEKKIRVIQPSTGGLEQQHGLSDSQDGLEYLRLQHQQVRELLDEVYASTDARQRTHAFHRLRDLLSRHETIEEMLLRPLTRRAGQEAVADARLREENDAKWVLARLDGLDPDGDEFRAEFPTFRDAVLAHAAAEEAEEFALVEERYGALERSRLAVAMRGATVAAPTHPHPRADTTAKNWLLGPFVGVVDRMRDAAAKLRR